MSLPPPPPPPLAPPPPPPPPPVASFPLPSSKLDPGGVVLDDVDVTHYMCVGQMGLYKHKEKLEGQERTKKELDIIFLSHYKTVVPIIQKGPLCGLVAVAMAAPLVQAEAVCAERLLEVAVDMGYTKQGEMFSAANMCRLVQSVLKEPVTSEVVVDCEESQMMQFLLQGQLLLIPYDADKNHSPCMKKGHKAHWMLISGCFLAVDNSTNIVDLTLLEEDEDYYERKLFHLKPDRKTTPDILKTLSQNPDSITDIVLYGQQGKSKHTSAWTTAELLASNRQLLELGPERDTDSYVVPRGGVEEGLCRQIVRIFRSDCIV